MTAPQGSDPWGDAPAPPAELAAPVVAPQPAIVGDWPDAVRWAPIDDLPGFTITAFRPIEDNGDDAGRVVTAFPDGIGPLRLAFAPHEVDLVIAAYRDAQTVATAQDGAL